MPPSGKSRGRKAAGASGTSPVKTRSQRRQQEQEQEQEGGDLAPSTASAELTYYTTLPPSSGGRQNGIQVISRRPLSSASAASGTDQLRNKFRQIEKDRVNKEAASAASSPSSPSPSSSSTSFWMLLVTHVNLFLYATCFFIQVNTLPYLSRQLGADPRTFGQLQTAFALAQLLGGPLFGRLGDVLGQRLALQLAFLASAASYAIMGVAQNLPMLFLSRLPAVFMHVMQGSQMLATHLSSKEERATALSRLGFSYGLGMMVGPTLGGYIAKFACEQTAAFVAAAGSLLSFILVVLFIPTPTVIHKKEQDNSQSTSRSLLDFNAIGQLLHAPDVAMVLFIQLVCVTPILLFQAMFSVIAMDQFGLPAEHNGMLLSYVGAISLFMQGIGISLVGRVLTDSAILNGSVVLLATAFYAMTLLSDLRDLLILLVPLVSALCLVNSVLTANVTKIAPEEHSGTMLGLNMAARSSIRSVAPALGGYLVQNHGLTSVGLVGVSCNVAVVVLLKLVKW